MCPKPGKLDHSVCDGTAVALSSDEITTWLARFSEWSLDGSKISRSFRFEAFLDSIEFVNKVAAGAERLNHHPNITIENKRIVGLTLWTHKMNCLTKLDLDLAEVIEQEFQAQEVSDECRNR